MGKLLPTGTQVEVKIIHHPGIKALYEFNMGADDWDPESRPWGSVPYGEGENLRTGAWLSDHSGPSTIAVAGDRVVVGAKGAEAGDSIMILNKDGVKMHGMGGLGGFGGNAPAPNDLWQHDDDNVVLRSGNSFKQLNVRTFKFRNLGKVSASCLA